ncbi:MAG: winged helix-turn-helix transcriptional regulator [Desulfobacteraceae bacterium]|nr:MAG: winged helix-turn-helix transcriptional regulator [Desulfobacteraceae bacterium]
MARSRDESDLKELAKQRYEGLLAQKNMLDAEVKAIEAYLQSIGERRAGGNVRRKKAETESGSTGKSVSKPRKRFVTQEILSLIEKAKQGISIDQMMKQTNLERQTVNGVLNRMKREGRVRAKSRGVYVKA